MNRNEEGGCQCGTIRYRFTGEPMMLAVCHCTECQRQTGSAFGMSLIVRKEDFQILRGEPKIYERRADSGRLVRCAFCADCGTRIYHEPERMAGTALNIKPGTLDDRSWLQPAAHVWTASKQPWVEIPDGVQTFDTQP